MPVDQQNLVPAIDCTDFVLLVDDLVDSAPEQWGAVVAKHLRECPPCLIYLQQMHDLKILLSHVFDGEKLSDEHIEGVVNTLAAFRRDLSR
jgi:predicted anti-sigma-YlaC factor YlaD